MGLFRVYLAIIFVAVSIYTVPVVLEHGFILFQVFFSDMAEMGWPGQFNFDFMMMLLMSATWVAWRHRFSVGGLVLAIPAFLGGAPFLTVYLLYQSFQTDDVATLFLGANRA